MEASRGDPKRKILGNDSTRSFLFCSAATICSWLGLQEVSRQGAAGVPCQQCRIPAPPAKAECNQWLWAVTGETCGLARAARWLRPPASDRIRAACRMFSFVPQDLQQPPALVVVLHGCGQTAAGYDLGAGWSTLAKHYGFALLMPEQQPSNNANGCFNWFNPEDTARGSGEACSIRQMIARMVADHGIERTPHLRHRAFRRRRHDVGDAGDLSRKCSPAGAVIAGLPFGVASNVREALNGMFQSPSAPGLRTGRSGAPRFQSQRALAEDFGVAWQRRSHGQSRQRQRDRQAMARRASSALRADVGRHRRRPSAPDLVERGWRNHGRVLHHHRYGPRHAARDRRQ